MWVEILEKPQLLAMVQLEVTYHDFPMKKFWFSTVNLGYLPEIRMI